MLLRMWVMMLVSFAVEAQDPQKQDPRKEAAIGAQMAKEVRRGTTPLESPEVQSYVERIGKKLASQFTSEGRTYTFAVVTDSLSGRTHEPIALPGGYVFVSTSLLSAAQDEAGFAGMLAHGMAHIVISTQSSVGRDVPLVFMGGWRGLGDQDIGLQGPFLKLQRTRELDADREAVRVMSAAGYDPHALVRYIEALQPADNAFSSLPPPSERIAALEETIGKLPAQTYSSSGDEEFRASGSKPGSQIQIRSPVASLLRYCGRMSVSRRNGLLPALRTFQSVSLCADLAADRNVL